VSTNINSSVGNALNVNGVLKDKIGKKIFVGGMPLP